MGQYLSRARPSQPIGEERGEAETAQEESAQLEESAAEIPADVAAILEYGVDSVKDAPSLPSLQEATLALKAKYGIDSTLPQKQASEEQEARLRALLKSKRRPQPTVVEASTPESAKVQETDAESSSEESSSDAESSSSESSVEIEPKANQSQNKRRRTAADSDEELSSDDEDASPAAKKAKAEALQASLPKTDHEVLQPPISKPDFDAIPDRVTITALGKISSIVQNVLVIQSSQSGHDSVLDSGTVVCLPDRRVLGEIFDTFGPVQAPVYSIRFHSADDPILLECQKGADVYYAPEDLQLASIRSTHTLKEKGSDASNFYDEEPHQYEIEFSDDEAEAAYKRNLKQQKQENRRQHEDAPYESPNLLREVEETHHYKIDGDLEYSPLPRPDTDAQYSLPAPDEGVAHPTLNEGDAPALSNLPAPPSNTNPTARQGENNRGKGQGRGRGGRGRGRGRGASNATGDRKVVSDTSRSATRQQDNYKSHSSEKPSYDSRGRGRGGSRGRGRGGNYPTQPRYSNGGDVSGSALLPPRPQFSSDGASRDSYSIPSQATLGQNTNYNPRDYTNAYNSSSRPSSSSEALRWQPDQYNASNYRYSNSEYVAPVNLPPLAELQKLQQTFANASRGDLNYDSRPYSGTYSEYSPHTPNDYRGPANDTVPTYRQNNGPFSPDLSNTAHLPPYNPDRYKR